MRKLLDTTLGIHCEAKLPPYQRAADTGKLDDRREPLPDATPAGRTRGRAALFGTCYGNYCEPHHGDDLAAVFEHNGIAVTSVPGERCCGMPKLELGDLQSVRRAKEANIPQLLGVIEAGWDIVAPVPSCVLMFKQELPLMFPDDADVQRVREHIFDPFEYLHLRHRQGALRTDFKLSLGKVSYHVACHQRVQNFGLKTRDILQLLTDTEFSAIERCSGHDGTNTAFQYARSDGGDASAGLLGAVELFVVRLNRHHTPKPSRPDDRW